VREEEGDIVDALRLLINYQRPIVAPLGQEGFVGGHGGVFLGLLGLIRLIGHIGLISPIGLVF
jgi:hypothetical protein